MDIFYKIESESKVLYNLNFNPLCGKQKRVAFVYLSNKFNTPNFKEVSYHPNTNQHFLILNILIELGYIIDVFSCVSSHSPSNFLQECNKYDYIIGFGPEYIKLCKLNQSAKKILFITENAPWIVKEKFKERIAYFYQRHKNKKNNIVSRDGYYTSEMFDVSDVGIAMNGPYNIERMKERLSNIYPICVNSLSNDYPIPNKDFNSVKKKFVWFGSSGIVHKGLDILIDTFSELPDLQLDVYGAPENELRGLEIPSNVIIHETINVNSAEFVDEVVSQHAFVLSLSCSEGMMSGVATCMKFGLIPIVTLETGFDSFPHVILFSNWKIEYVKETLNKCVAMPSEELKFKSNCSLQWANKNCSNSSFYDLLKMTLNEIIKQDI
jgi:hypothetical protein